MARPALSATRATAILNLLAAYPERSFTMAEVIRSTGINIASCHAILNALADEGYVTRTDADRRYVLGPALVAVGQSALVAQPLIARAREAAELLADDLGISVLLSTIVADEILALASRTGRNERSAGMSVGQRFPLAAPAGAHFVAWASDDEVEAWIGRAGPSSKEQAEEWKRALALVRKRGYQVTLRRGLDVEFGTVMAEMASGAPSLEFSEHAAQLIEAHGWHLHQPETIEPEESYDVVFIAAPIFNRDGKAVLSLGIGGFADRQTGNQIRENVARLMAACLGVMRDDRAE